MCPCQANNTGDQRSESVFRGSQLERRQVSEGRDKCGTLAFGRTLSTQVGRMLRDVIESPVDGDLDRQRAHCRGAYENSRSTDDVYILENRHKSCNP
jgi:hypothetical protein